MVPLPHEHASYSDASTLAAFFFVLPLAAPRRPDDSFTLKDVNEGRNGECTRAVDAWTLESDRDTAPVWSARFLALRRARHCMKKTTSSESGTNLAAYERSKRSRVDDVKNRRNSPRSPRNGRTYTSTRRNAYRASGTWPVLVHTQAHRNSGGRMLEALFSKQHQHHLLLSFVVYQ